MHIIAGERRGTQLFAPKGMDTRPTQAKVKESLFNIIQAYVPDAQVLDLFSGSGAMAFEAISRGAASAVLVDCDRAANAVQRQNAQKLRMQEQCRILMCDWQLAVNQLKAQGEKFDVVFLDPPYAMHDMTPVLDALRPLLTEEAVILLEHEAKTFPSIPDGFELYDNRKYGIAGVSFFRQWTTGEAES